MRFGMRPLEYLLAKVRHGMDDHRRGREGAQVEYRKRRGQIQRQVLVEKRGLNG